MSDEKNTSAKTNSLDEINKNKTLVSKADYLDKRSDCLLWCFPLGGLAFCGSMFVLPVAMKAIPFIPISLELRLLTGLLSAIPLSYLTIKRTKERCQKRVEDTYYYKFTYN